MNEIVSFVKKSYDDDKQDLFDDFFVYKALDELIPITENDFGTFNDVIVDKNNVHGYLIYRDKYYIFQPFDQNENVPLIYRTENLHVSMHEVSLYNYMKNMIKDKKEKKQSKKTIDVPIDDVQIYNFDDTFEYYDERNEYEYVGIIDKEISRRKNKPIEEINDVFKIREKLPKVLQKKRGTGIPSLKGAVCNTSKSIEYLEKVAKKIGITNVSNLTRTDICNLIEKEMLLKEKYGTDAKKNKYTYVRIPANHPQYQFPYNLEDRVRHIISKLRQSIKYPLEITTASIIKKSGQEKGYPSYIISIKSTKQVDEHINTLKQIGALKHNNEWKITIE